jgi:hypothetical protein
MVALIEGGLESRLQEDSRRQLDDAVASRLGDAKPLALLALALARLCARLDVREAQS